ncbi:unnamed protein product [Protopolystoma xenopodis]|uniref:Tyrosine-protein phosphatase domain-containing protein n=1 Tax=Protopolystoma xenopodis TaxID=117903 RepID=A0A3S5CBC2_9PLAT|nr:unnamed protein product [Protopolystoma xenopodis]
MSQTDRKLSSSIFWSLLCNHLVSHMPRTFEGRRVKCSQYWPSQTAAFGARRDGQLKAGVFTVTSLSETSEAGGLYRRSKLRVTRASTSFAPSSDFHGSAMSPSSTSGITGSSGKSLSSALQPAFTMLSRRSTAMASKAAALLNPAPLRSSTEDFQLPSAASSEQQSLEVEHLLFLGWPDFDVPSDADGFLAFLDVVNRQYADIVFDQHSISHSSPLSLPASNTSLSSNNNPMSASSNPHLTFNKPGTERCGLGFSAPAEKNTNEASSVVQDPNIPPNKVQIQSPYKTADDLPSPIVIHCSAGIGRTDKLSKFSYFPISVALSGL